MSIELPDPTTVSPNMGPSADRAMHLFELATAAMAVLGAVLLAITR